MTEQKPPPPQNNMPKPVPKPAPKPANSAPKADDAPRKTFGVSRGTVYTPERVIIYGPGGIGKSELYANASSIGMKVVAIDIEQSTSKVDVTRIEGVEDYSDLVAVLLGHEELERADIIAIDSFTKLEEYCVARVLNTIKIGKEYPTSIESYGYGRGFSHVYDAFNVILGMLDTWARKGKHIVGTAHDCVASVPNPSGEDWKRYEPRLQNQGNGNIRARTKEWSTQTFFLSYEIFVGENRKATGSGTRRIYTSELPTHLAKNRGLPDEGMGFPYEQYDASIWKKLFNKE